MNVAVELYVNVVNVETGKCVCMCYSLSGRPGAGHVLTHPYPPRASSEIMVTDHTGIARLQLLGLRPLPFLW